MKTLRPGCGGAKIADVYMHNKNVVLKYRLCF